jgi:hypothetical protein
MDGRPVFGRGVLDGVDDPLDAGAEAVGLSEDGP